MRLRRKEESKYSSVKTRIAATLSYLLQVLIKVQELPFCWILQLVRLSDTRYETKTKKYPRIKKIKKPHHMMPRYSILLFFVTQHNRQVAKEIIILEREEDVFSS